ncbi:Dihydroorotate dehydrogenase (quinone), mitochondrial-like protein [Drosera capensis]
MAVSVRRFISKNLFRCNSKFISNLSKSYSTASSSSTTVGAGPKIPQPSKKIFFGFQGRLFTGATLGLIIAGGAYVSTVDEATWHPAVIGILFFTTQGYFRLPLANARRP